MACANTEAFQIFDICHSLQRNSATGAKENVLEQTIESTASTLYAKVQAKGTYDIENVQLSYPVVYEESMNTVLIQECIRYNKLVSVILGSLPQLLKALKGSVAMTAELEATANRYCDCEDVMSIGLRRYSALLPLHFYYLLLPVCIPFPSTFPFLFLAQSLFLPLSLLLPLFVHISLLFLHSHPHPLFNLHSYPYPLILMLPLPPSLSEQHRDK